MEARAARSPEAGVTLLEILIVLVIVAVLAGATSLAVGRVGGGAGLAEDAEMLAQRVTLAADHAGLTGVDGALIWDDSAYRFTEFGADGWQPHTIATLAATRSLGPVRLSDGPGHTLITADLIPEGGRVAEWVLTDGPARARVRFDGVQARVAGEAE